MSTPADRGPRQPWRPGTPPPAPLAPDTPTADIRIGYARCRTFPDGDDGPHRPYCHRCRTGSYFSGVPTESAYCAERGHKAYGMGAGTRWEQAQERHQLAKQQWERRQDRAVRRRTHGPARHRGRPVTGNELPPATDRRLVHLIDGLAPSGQKVSAVCSCGFRTTPRATEERALAALRQTHPLTTPTCELCGREHPRHDWLALRSRHVQVHTDPATGNQFLVCRGLARSCQNGAEQRQMHLDRTAFEAFGLQPGRPTLRVVGGTTGDVR